MTLPTLQLDYGLDSLHSKQRGGAGTPMPSGNANDLLYPSCHTVTGGSKGRSESFPIGLGPCVECSVTVCRSLYDREPTCGVGVRSGSHTISFEVLPRYRLLLNSSDGFDDVLDRIRPFAP